MLVPFAVSFEGIKKNGLHEEHPVKNKKNKAVKLYSELTLKA